MVCFSDIFFFWIKLIIRYKVFWISTPIQIHSVCISITRNSLKYVLLVFLLMKITKKYLEKNPLVEILLKILFNNLHHELKLNLLVQIFSWQKFQISKNHTCRYVFENYKCNSQFFFCVYLKFNSLDLKFFIKVCPFDQLYSSNKIIRSAYLKITHDISSYA